MLFQYHFASREQYHIIAIIIMNSNFYQNVFPPKGCLRLVKLPSANTSFRTGICRCSLLTVGRDNDHVPTVIAGVKIF